MAARRWKSEGGERAEAVRLNSNSSAAHGRCAPAASPDLGQTKAGLSFVVTARTVSIPLCVAPTVGTRTQRETVHPHTRAATYWGRRPSRRDMFHHQEACSFRASTRTLIPKAALNANIRVHCHSGVLELIPIVVWDARCTCLHNPTPAGAAASAAD